MIMERILLLAHTEPSGQLSKTTLEVLGGAVRLARGLDGADLAVGLIGSSAASAAESLAGCGAAGFHAVAGEDFDVGRYASDVAAAEALVRASEATIVLAPATSRFARALPGAVQRLGGRIDTRVTAAEPSGGTLQVERWYYRQRMVATLTRADRPWILTVEPGAFEPWEGEPGAVPIHEVAVDPPAGGWRTRVTGEETASAEAQTIRPDAELLLVAGAGWTKKQSDGKTHVGEAENLIRSFLEVSQASLGSSKSLVDQSSEGEEVISFMTHLNQVGQTGATPRHRKGLSTCCHGEEPHVVGWRFIKERRAVNLDPNCGWARGKADVVYVADAFEVMAKVNALLA
jgi:electron transfer flavoprotein alpha subunit